MQAHSRWRRWTTALRRSFSKTTPATTRWSTRATWCSRAARACRSTHPLLPYCPFPCAFRGEARGFSVPSRTLQGTLSAIAGPLHCHPPDVPRSPCRAVREMMVQGKPPTRAEKEGNARTASQNGRNGPLSRAHHTPLPQLVGPPHRRYTSLHPLATSVCSRVLGFGRSGFSPPAATVQAIDDTSVYQATPSSPASHPT